MASDQEQDDTRSKDLFQMLGKWLVAASPLAGLPMFLVPLAQDLYEFLIPPPSQKRTALLARRAAEGLRQLETAGIVTASSDERLAFVHAALRSAGETAHREKLELFRNAILNGARGRVDHLDYFRTLLETLTVDHIRVLKFFARPHAAKRLNPVDVVGEATAVILAEEREWHDRRDYVAILFRELWTRGLLLFPIREQAGRVLDPRESELYVLDGCRLSSLGDGFLEMIANSSS